MTQNDLLQKIDGLLDRRLNPLQEDIQTLKDGQERIEAEQRRQGEDINGIKGEQKRQGEDINGIKAEQKRQGEDINGIKGEQKRQGNTLVQHGKILAQHGKILVQHGKILAQHGKMLENHSQMLGQMKSTLEAISAGQESQVTKADFHDLRVELTKRDKAYERRIESLEEATGNPNPHKN